MAFGPFEFMHLGQVLDEVRKCTKVLVDLAEVDDRCFGQAAPFGLDDGLGYEG
jgi:hypothetical protein